MVSDTSPISNLIVINKLELLHVTFGKIVIPEFVFMEVISLEQFGFDLTLFRSAEWIEKREINDLNTYNTLVKKLDRGEAQAITLSMELHSEYLLIDEKKGRTIANEMGVQTIGFIGALIKCKNNKDIQELKPILDELRQKAKFRISDELYNEVLLAVNEK